jgi:hypothetical protein
MNELDLLAALRDEVPLSEVHPPVAETVLAAIGSEAARSALPSRAIVPGLAAIAASWPAATGTVRRARGRRVLVPAAVALALAATVTSVLGFGLGHSAQPPRQRVVSWSGVPGALPPEPGLSVGRARTAAELAAFATRAAAAAPQRAPGPREWVFMMVETAASSAGGGGFLFGPPDKRVTGLEWNRVDWREAASASLPAQLPPTRRVRGRLSISPESPGTLTGWRSISYSYLNSLPTSPARLESVILANSGDPRGTTPGVAVFDSIFTLFQGETEGTWVPRRLAATMYQVLLRLPGVRFDSGTDLAGRTGLGLYLVEDGWLKRELVINPVTYTFMGSEVVAARDHTLTGTDGVRHVRNGQVLSWLALLYSAIVRHVGQVP